LGIGEASVVMLSSTARPECGAGDAELAKTLRGADVPVVVVPTNSTAEDEYMTPS